MNNDSDINESLIERVAKLRKAFIGHDYNYETCDMMLAEIKAHAARSGWVKIEDIPEEWRDGRKVDLWIEGAQKDPFRLNDCRYREKPLAAGYSNWGRWNYAVPKGVAKYATLPPQPPSQKGDG